MQVTKILIVGTNRPILATIARLIDKEGKWLCTITYSVSEATTLCLEKDFGLLLIGAGLADEEELELKQQMAILRPKLPVVKHYGGGSGLLFAEIYQALATS